MDTYRAFLAIIISFVILLGYQYFFGGFQQPAPVSEPVKTQQGEQTAPAAPKEAVKPEVAAPMPAPTYDREPKSVTVDTDLYTATLSEDGGTIRSFVLKKQKETNAKDSPGMQLVKTDATDGFPLQFAWGSVLNPQVLFSSDKQNIKLSANNGNAELRMAGRAANGLVVERVYTFHNDSYLIDLAIKVRNNGDGLLQGNPQLQLVDARFEGGANPASKYMFGGAAAYMNGELLELKPDTYKEGPKSFQGKIDWVGLESNYFLIGLLPLEGAGTSFTVSGTENLFKTSLAGNLDTLQPGTEKEYKYHVFCGPKKLDMLKTLDFNLDKSVNFGWFDVIAKPTLWLLNLLHDFCHNYGIAIILVTILFKAAFWPISQKGMKSMKNMQKLQPKMAKIREKYKNDPTRMNQEVMNLYKTYKVNPLGGCLPMVLQIPVFFALYKVLLQSIELRHAPFMLWITDLSAPDRLWLGFQIPYLGGLPVLTLLMGASMYFQQKLSPTTADPTQAKVMQFLPLIFTFMFLNFASGLVLYWFVNNLLSILQQFLINRDTKRPEAA